MSRKKSWYIEGAHSMGSHIVYIINRIECLEQSLGILNVRTLWDPISFTLLIALNV
jgi:hypothetical protein